MSKAEVYTGPIAEACMPVFYMPEVGDAIIDALHPSVAPEIIRHVGERVYRPWAEYRGMDTDRQPSYWVFLDGTEPVQVGTTNDWIIGWKRVCFPPLENHPKIEQYRVLRKGSVVFETPED